MKDKLLEVINLTTTFPGDEGKVVAVDGVSFDIGQGETVGIVGESGCGKSVTSLSIIGLVAGSGGKIESGQILFNGEDLLKKSPKEMRKINGNQIAMIFQEPMSSLNPLLTIGRQLSETIVRHQKISKKEALARSVDLLDLVGIPNPQERIKGYPTQLSGGQRQRVMIAMALSSDPKLLIADEPTTALDVTIQAQILDLMKALKAKVGMSIMLITHDLGVVADMADRIVVMYGGQVVEMGTVQEIFKAPRHPYTKGLLKAIPRMSKSIEPLYMIPGAIPKPTEYPLGCRFYDRCDERGAICMTPPPLDQSKSQFVRCWIGSAAYQKQEVSQ